MNETVFRRGLVELLRGGNAHVGARRALGGVDPKIRTRRPGPGLRSVWEILEHLRIAQEDILKYTLDPSWRSPPFPDGYWPAEGSRATARRWSGSVAGFLAGLDEACALARDRSRDLTARVPHGEGRTYLRQILLIADHNAYHLGQIVAARKALGNWRG